MLDADDFARADCQFIGTAEQRLHQMLLDFAERLPPSVDKLYIEMLERTEKVFGINWARAFADLIALSRFGWRESDLRVMMPKVILVLSPSSQDENWNALKFAVLRRGFRAHLIKRGPQEQWDFFHAQIRLAIRQRNLNDSVLCRQLHSIIVDHLESLPVDDTVRRNELMFHLIGADDQLRAAQYYSRDMADDEVENASHALADYILLSEIQQRDQAVEWVALVQSFRSAQNLVCMFRVLLQPIVAA